MDNVGGTLFQKAYTNNVNAFIYSVCGHIVDCNDFI